MPEHQIDLTKPICAARIEKQADGAYAGHVYHAYQGLPGGHIEVLAINPEALLSMAQTLLAFAQAQQSKVTVVPGAALPRRLK